MKQRLFSLGVLLALVITLTPSVAHAGLSDEQKRALQMGVLYFNTEADCPAQDTPATDNLTGTVYMLGDSVTDGSRAQLDAALKSKGFSNVIINAQHSRSLANNSPPLNGLGILESDKAQYASASAVIVALGTNGNGLTDANINSAVQIIKGGAANAQIFWVNVGADNNKRLGAPLAADSLNTIIQQSAGSNYKVIDWSSQVKAHPEYISSDGLGVHPSEAGKTAFANTVLDGLGSGGSAVTTSTGGGDCVCSVGGNLSGADNPEKIWNYLLGKGMKPPQIAGILGNMQHESHFEPRLVEYGYLNSRGEISRQDQPSSLDDHPPPDDPKGDGGQPGYGIVQWSGGRKQPLRDMAAATNTLASDLALQLENLWRELQGPYKRSVFDPIMATDSLEVATDIFLSKFEIPRNIPGTRPGRIATAKEILARYGNGTGGGGASSSSSGGCASASADAAGIVQHALLYSWPEKGHGMTPKPEYAAAIKQINPGAPHGGADCGAFVSTVMRASGADPEYPLLTTGVQEQYVRSHPEKYTIVEANSVNDLLPGDILIVNKNSGAGSEGHTSIFVGKQPGGNRDKADASLASRMPNLGVTEPDLMDDLGRGKYMVARLK